MRILTSQSALSSFLAAWGGGERLDGMEWGESKDGIAWARFRVKSYGLGLRVLGSGLLTIIPNSSARVVSLIHELACGWNNHSTHSQTATNTTSCSDLGFAVWRSALTEEMEGATSNMTERARATRGFQAGVSDLLHMRGLVEHSEGDQACYRPEQRTYCPLQHLS